MTPANILDAYEALRAAVLRADPDVGHASGILRRGGMAAWLRALIPAPLDTVPTTGTTRQPPTGRDVAPAASELTRLIAGIVLTITAEPAHV